VSEVCLPHGWESELLGELASLITKGTTPTTAGHSYRTEGIPFIKVENMDKNGVNLSSVKQYIDETAHESLKRSQFKENDVLFSIAGTIGKTALVGKRHLPANTNQAVAIIRGVTDYFEPRFLRQQLRATADQIFQDKARGGAMNNISLADLKSVDILVPPYAEQTRIADKLDQLLAQVDTLKARVDAIPSILKRFRQSLLAAAVSGKLTEEWRESSSYLVSTDGFRYESSWEYLVIENVADVKGGKRLPKGEKLVSYETDFPYIKAGQLKNGGVEPLKQEYLEEHVQKQISRYTVNTDDAYITIVGACIGDAGLIPAAYDGANLTENAAKLCNYKREVIPAYLSIWLRSKNLQELIQFEIKSGAQGKLALKRIKTLPIPLPEYEEQHEIVRLVEQYFTFADQVEARVNAAQKQINHLTQSILAKAFRGELVDQDPNDESASVLLDRIKAEREANNSKVKPKRKVGKKK
jgi:type I restriction enzyme, S subunit